MQASTRKTQFFEYDGTTKVDTDCAEKSLKAYLVYQGEKIERTHNLIKLVYLCSNLDKNFESLTSRAKTLNPFSTQHRYPDEYDIPDIDDTLEAIELSEYFLTFVTKKISEHSKQQLHLFK